MDEPLPIGAHVVLRGPRRTAGEIREVFFHRVTRGVGRQERTVEGTPHHPASLVESTDGELPLCRWDELEAR